MKSDEKMKKTLPICESTVIHREIIENVKSKMQEEEVLYELGDFSRF